MVALEPAPEQMIVIQGAVKKVVVFAPNGDAQ
jgi:hypothetical protein